MSEAGGSTWDELFLFVADTPIGPWAPHPMNPIVSDVRCARPGGALFRRDGVLYRPGRIATKRYGHSLAVMEVTELRLIDTLSGSPIVSSPIGCQISMAATRSRWQTT